MTISFNHFETKNNDELIVIANGTTEDWQQIAIDKAKQILKNRNISEDLQRKRLKEINSELEEFNQQLSNYRMQEDYSLFEKITMVIWWPRELIWGWGLKRDGYKLKAKRRLQLIGLGILLTVLTIIWANYQWDKDEQSRIEEINKVDISEWERNYYGVDSSNAKN